MCQRHPRCLKTPPEPKRLEGPQPPRLAGVFVCENCAGTGIWRERVCEFCHGHGTWWGPDTPVAVVRRVNGFRSRWAHEGFRRSVAIHDAKEATAGS